ncbi:hypothetical protein IVB30_41900 [Bradyrhizobium sp. 200]|uniref:hypothetical protein n=1 Tax=Bradyrhizobium sp. 200 TaxID=2782665 RepID=UPI001FFE449C|nr:hypothetical protein [Bradyrhizobium sp. 200]UPJ49407.1 hypothetical protein IVB30_41900 [Bradyrhizobium sp. 200]
MYRRADLWRTFVLVVALLLTAVSTGAFAREFRAADPQDERHPIDALHSRRFGAEKDALEHIRTGAADLDRTNVALIRTMMPVLIAPLRRVERI